jgi:hypothetical protein
MPLLVLQREPPPTGSVATLVHGAAGSIVMLSP